MGYFNYSFPDDAGPGKEKEKDDFIGRKVIGALEIQISTQGLNIRSKAPWDHQRILQLLDAHYNEIIRR